MLNTRSNASKEISIMPKMDHRLSSIETTLLNINDKLNNILQKMEGLEKVIEKQDKRISQIENQMIGCMEIKSKVDMLQADNRLLKERLTKANNDILDLSREKNKKKLELVGVPKRENEDLIKILQDIAKTGKENLTPLNVKEAFRKKESPNGPGIIVYKLSHQKTRDGIVNIVKKNKSNAADIGFSNSRSPIYANVPLAPETKKVLFHSRKEKESRGWAKVWVYAAEVYIKLETTGNPIKVRSMDELEILIQ